MIKALSNFFRCINDIEPSPKYSFTYDRYDDENEAYSEIKNVDINIGVNAYTMKKIIYAYEIATNKNDKSLNFLKYFLDKFLSKNNPTESIIYIHLDKRIIRIRNITLNNHRVLKLSIDK
jgi:hypothetical protein